MRQILGFGTTSACAENTSSGTRYAGGHWNYLRVRGEYPLPWLLRPAHLELPPRARRIQQNRRHEWLQLRTTSACAENTCRSFVRHGRSWNYLRVRGEYWGFRLDLGVRVELPPRARRIRAGASSMLPVMGTTSACAENTDSVVRKQIQIRNYLRVRGEYHRSKGGGVRPRELPPRARRIQCPIDRGT